MEHPRTTAKDFFLWSGAMLALFGSIYTFIALFFDYINYVFPDPLQYYDLNPYNNGISSEMAALIVLFPVFLGLIYFIRRDIRTDATRKEVWVRRWALMFTLFVAGAAVTIDLIILLTTFLNGEELTARFLLKVLIVLLVAAASFMHFIADLWGYWDQYPKRAQSVAWSTGALMFLTILSGFVILGTPAQARLARFDEQKVSDLQNIQSMVTSFWEAKQRLPENLTAAADPLMGETVPVDPQTGTGYRYMVTGKTSFQLCATFNRTGGAQYTSPAGSGWQHGAGDVCFSRTIDPELYPPTVQRAPSVLN